MAAPVTLPIGSGAMVHFHHPAFIKERRVVKKLTVAPLLRGGGETSTRPVTPSNNRPITFGTRAHSCKPRCLNCATYVEKALRGSPRKQTEARIGHIRTESWNLSQKVARELWLPAPRQHVMLSDMGNICGGGSLRKPTEADGS